MDNYSPSTAATEQTAGFVESLFMIGEDKPMATKPPTTKSEPTVPVAASKPTPIPPEKSGNAEQIVTAPLSEVWRCLHTTLMEGIRHESSRC
jgi:hypothetical protein